MPRLITIKATLVDDAYGKVESAVADDISGHLEEHDFVVDVLGVVFEED